MHLDKRPTYFVKNGVRKPVYYSVDARQLAEAGWVPEGSAQAESVKVTGVPIPITSPEPVVEAEESESEPEPEAIDLASMTKFELTEFAKQQSIEIDPYALKSTILETIEAALGG